MNLLFRLIFTFLVSPFRSSLDVFDVCATPFRVWPTDLDVLMHMNNGKYFSLMDLARTDLMIRSGVFKKLSRQKFYPVVSEETMKFKRSLKPFQKFFIETRVVGRDEMGIYLEQTFKVKNQVHAFSIVRAQFLEKGGRRVPSQELFSHLGKEESKMLPPQYVQDWHQALNKGFSCLAPHP